MLKIRHTIRNMALTCFSRKYSLRECSDAACLRRLWARIVLRDDAGKQRRYIHDLFSQNRGYITPRNQWIEVSNQCMRRILYAVSGLQNLNQLVVLSY